MKKLILIRHGRAEDPVAGISDLERSLTTKGKVISKLMARKLRSIERSQGIILTSPAFRAIETALNFAGEFSMDPGKIIINSHLYYNMDLNYLPGIIAVAGEEADTITMFGHNPSFTEIADSLCHEGCGFIPKCGIIGISFNVNNWSEIRPKSGKLEFFLKPE